MELDFHLGGAGWADICVRDGFAMLEMQASYLSDALGDMAQATLHLLRGAREATFAFEDEPGQHRWVLTRGDSDSLCIRIIWFEETYSWRRPEDGTEVFACDCTVMDFAGPVSHMLSLVLADEGIEGYKRRWKSNDFPLGTYHEIRRLLDPESG
jgi:hypothetical protein